MFPYKMAVFLTQSNTELMPMKLNTVSMEPMFRCWSDEGHTRNYSPLHYLQVQIRKFSF